MKIGAAFPESIHSGKKYFIKKSRFSYEKGPTMRVGLLPICVGIFCLIVLTRLFFLQVIQGQYYRNLSNNNRLRTTLIHAPRGVIFDRNGKALVLNMPG